MEKPRIELDRSSLHQRLLNIEREILLLKHRISKIEKLIGMERTPQSYLLERIDTTNPRAVELLFSWAEFLRSKNRDLEPVLDYYISIGWISKEVAELLKRYAEGMDVPTEDEGMRPEDHIRSLDFINKIREVMK